MKTPYRFLPDLFLRTPFYSFTSYDLARLPEILGQQTFQNAIRLASPVLYETLQKKHFDYGRLQEKEKHALAKYYNRMCFRPTPFGAFAAFSLLHWGSGEPIRLAGDEAALLHLLPDQGVIQRLNQLCGQDSTTLLIPNPARYTAGQEYRFIRTVTQEQGPHTFSLESVEVLPFHTELLGRLGERPHSVTESRELIMNQSGCPAEDAVDYLDFLIGAQVLIPAGRGHLISARDKNDRFAELRSSLPAGTVLPEPAFPASVPGGRSAYYAAIERPRLAGSPDPRMQHELQDALEALSRLNRGPANTLLAQFTRDFSARYDLQKVPLLQALDPDTGVRYGDFSVEASGDDVLDDVRFPAAARQEAPLDWQSARRLFLSRWPGGPGKAIILTETDLRKLEVPPPSAPPPNALALMFRTAGDHILIEHTGGPTPNNLNGRFSVFSDAAHRLCLDLAAPEQAAHPDILFADIGMLSDTHADNISRRRQIYPYEIPLNVYSDLEPSQQLLPADLLLSVRQGQLILESASLGKRVIPRLSTAYNFYQSGLSVFRLLCDLQYQGLQAPRTLDMEQLFPGLPYYPRVSYGRCILSPARWRFAAEDTRCLTGATEAELMPAVRAFRAHHHLPRQVSMGLADQQLVFNLSEPDEAAFFARCIRQPGEILLQEYLLPDKTVRAGGRPVAGQFVAYLAHDERVYAQLSPENLVPASFPRQFRMGSEWFYLKVYCSPGLADRLLLDVIAPAVESLGNAVSGWFFIRYQDPDQHLRLRFRLPSAAISGLMSALHGGLGQDQLVRNFQSDTYQRELERYGADLMEKVEDLFCTGSQMVVSFLHLAQQDTSRTAFRLAICTLAEMAAMFYPGTDDRIGFVTAVTENLFREFGGAKSLRLSLDRKYRDYQPKIRSWLEAPGPFPGMDTFSGQLREIEGLAASYPEERKIRLRADLAHMQLNRTFRSRQRQQELLAYFCLQKYLRSQKARS